MPRPTETRWDLQKPSKTQRDLQEAKKAHRNMPRFTETQWDPQKPTHRGEKKHTEALIPRKTHQGTHKPRETQRPTKTWQHSQKHVKHYRSTQRPPENHKHVQKHIKTNRNLQKPNKADYVFTWRPHTGTADLSGEHPWLQSALPSQTKDAVRDRHLMSLETIGDVWPHLHVQESCWRRSEFCDMVP